MNSAWHHHRRELRRLLAAAPAVALPWSTARGRQTAKQTESVTAPAANTIRFQLKEPYAPLMALLSLQTSAAIILPANKQPAPLTEYIGTGPYRFQERVPDRYIILKRHEQYSA